MWLLRAPVEKFGRIPPGIGIISKDVPFFNNIAYCPKFYWKKIHVDNGCIDITPFWMRRERRSRPLTNILIISKGGVGDVIWGMPFIRDIKTKYPQSNIVVLTDERNYPLFINFPYIAAAVKDEYWNAQSLMAAADEIWDFGGVATIYKNYMKMDPVDAIFKMADIKPPKEKKLMRAHLILTAQEGKAAVKAIEEQGINLAKDDVVTICTESSTPNRDWPIHNIQRVTQMLQKKGYKVIWLSEKKELSDLYFLSCTCSWITEAHFEHIPKDISFTCPRCKQKITFDMLEKAAGIVNFAGKTNLRQYMAIVALSDLFIGPNSSGMVIATSLEIPTIGLFGAFSPKNRTRYYEKFTPLIAKEKCSPCNEHWTECPNGHPAPCMRNITPEMVFNAATYMLVEYKRDKRGKVPTQ
jgi:ADP-heptose:LPS heptosyltransferase